MIRIGASWGHIDVEYKDYIVRDCLVLLELGDVAILYVYGANCLVDVSRY